MPEAHQDLGQLKLDDPLLLENLLADDERMIRDTARAYAQDKLAPRVIEAYRGEHTDRAIFNEMGELGLLGVTLPEQYGCAGASYVAYGLVAGEIERVDSGYRSMTSEQAQARLSGQNRSQRPQSAKMVRSVPTTGNASRVDAWGTAVSPHGPLVSTDLGERKMIFAPLDRGRRSPDVHFPSRCRDETDW